MRGIMKAVNEGLNMASFRIREALLDDTHAICRLAQMQIGVWQRIDAGGRVEDVTYEQLSIYERWLHGGPWMSVETGALQLSHLRRGAGIGVVVEDEGQLVGYGEAYVSDEPPPYGYHVHLGVVHVHPGFADRKVDDMLLAWLIDWAKKAGIPRITAHCAAHDAGRIAFYEHYKLAQVESVHRMTIPTKQGQVFYRALDDAGSSYEAVRGWHLNIGRLGSSRFQWETLWPRTWDAIPEIAARRVHRLRLQAAGQDAFLLIREQLYRKRQADVFCWTAKPPTTQLITAIRDWANSEGYRRLVMAIVESSVKTLGLDAETDGYIEYAYSKDL